MNETLMEMKHLMHGAHKYTGFSELIGNALEAPFACWDYRPPVSPPFLADFWQIQLGLCGADSQMSSSILIREAYRRHQPRLHFPWQNPKADFSHPELRQSNRALRFPVETLSICHHHQSCQLAAQEPIAHVSAKTLSILLGFLSTE